MADPSFPKRVLFVCLGNICRSPLAEGVFRHLLAERGAESRYLVDSAGTGGWHVGEDPDPRTVTVARKHGIRLEGTARQLRPRDLTEFDLLVAMDRQNLRDLRQVAGAPAEASSSLVLLREFDPEADGDLDVPDPYYGGPDGFDQVFRMVHRSCAALLEELENGPGA